MVVTSRFRKLNQSNGNLIQQTFRIQKLLYVIPKRHNGKEVLLDSGKGSQFTYFWIFVNDGVLLRGHFHSIKMDS